MAIIKLSRGENCLVDDEDFDFLSQWIWRRGGDGYARRTQSLTGKRRAIIKMHRLIIGAQQGEIVDHINRKRLDNRRSNLRIVNWFESSQNRSNGYFLGVDGVTIHKQSGKFQAAFKGRYLGLFSTIDAASRAFQEVATK